MKFFIKKSYSVMVTMAIVMLVLFAATINVKAADQDTLDGANPYAAVFDASFYAGKYPDLAAAFGNNEGMLLQHFIQCGMAEGRQGSAEFDPVSYMNRYADLRAVYGNNMKLYYIHYLQIGKKEGRVGTAATATATSNTTAQPVAGDYITTDGRPVSKAQAQSIIYSFKASYPEGMRYTNDDFYAWNGGIYYGGYGCAGFTFMISDAICGTAKAWEHNDLGSIKIGDILRVANDSHSVLVAEINDNGVVLAEANYNSSVHWGRTMSWSELSSTLNYVMTRYQ